MAMAIKMLSIVVLVCIGFTKTNGCLFTEGKILIFHSKHSQVSHLVENIRQNQAEDCPLAWAPHNCEILVGEFVRKSLQSASSVNDLEHLSIQNRFLVIDACEAERIDQYQAKVIIHKPYATYEITVSPKTDTAFLVFLIGSRLQLTAHSNGKAGYAVQAFLSISTSQHCKAAFHLTFRRPTELI